MFFRTLFLILFALLLGIIPSIWIVQNDSNIQQYFKEKLIQSLERDWKAKVELEDFDLNLFTTSVYLKKIKVNFLCDSKCVWKAEYAKVSLFKLLSLIKKKAYLDFIVDDFEVFVFGQHKDAVPEIQKHLTDIFEMTDSTTIDIILKTLRINNLKLKIIDETQSLLFFDLPGRFFGRKVKLLKNEEQWIISANLSNGNFLFNNSCFVKKINGFLNLFQSDSNSSFNAKFKGDFRPSYDEESVLFMTGNFENNNLKVDLETKNGLLKYKLNLDSCFDGEKLKTNINICSGDFLELTGKAECVFDLFKAGLLLKNTRPIFITSNNDFEINSGDLKLKLNLDDKFNLRAKYFIDVDKKDGGGWFKTKGNLNLKDSVICINGKTSFTNYLIKAKLLPIFYITKFCCFKDKKHDYYIDLNFDEHDKSIGGKVKNCILKFFLPSEYNRYFLIDKKYFNLKLFQDNIFSQIRGKLVFDDGPFYLPDSYNLIEKFKSDFSFDFFAKKIVFNDSEIQFYKGNVFCPKARLHFDSDLQLCFIHSPIQINDLLINWGKTFYGFIYGNVLMQKKNKERLIINGDVILKKAFLKDNTFFLQSHSSLQSFGSSDSASMDIELDLNLSNEVPITVDTGFLNAKANFYLNIKTSQLNNRNSFSKVLGQVAIESGEVKFLKNKLYINRGKIQFMPNRMNDPLINIVAKNKIKKYFISMIMSGTMQNPKIMFESTPELTEAQILALLMSGSENASFQTDLPVILMQNLSNWIIGNKKLMPKAKSFFQKATLPFKYVQITPNFTDQSGRGGIRGTISIDINKQLNAQIQKNFNLQEDFAFQVEYFLTDDFNIKAIKDQRGELGSEMEVRFKF